MLTDAGFCSDCNFREGNSSTYCKSEWCTNLRRQLHCPLMLRRLTERACCAVPAGQCGCFPISRRPAVHLLPRWTADWNVPVQVQAHAPNSHVQGMDHSLHKACIIVTPSSWSFHLHVSPWASCFLHAGSSMLLICSHHSCRICRSGMQQAYTDHLRWPHHLACNSGG